VVLLYVGSAVLEAWNIPVWKPDERKSKKRRRRWSVDDESA
jgi:hypothetical protein